PSSQEREGSGFRRRGPFAFLSAGTAPTLRLLRLRSDRIVIDWAKIVALTDGVAPCRTPIALTQPGAKSRPSHQLTWSATYVRVPFGYQSEQQPRHASDALR